jgi:adenine deaminase
VEELAPVLTEEGVDPRHCLLVTDDVHPETLVEDGHLDRAVRAAVEAGIDPLVAIQMATLNPSEYFGLRHEVGSLAPGRLADVLFVEDLRTFRPHRVLADGRPVPERLTGPAYPERAYRSVRLPRKLTRDDLRIPARGQRARVRAIGLASDTVTTQHLVVEAPVEDGAVPASVALDLVKAASIERHGGPGTLGLGFVRGLGLRRGAVASTVAHDNHNLNVAGVTDDDMLFAVEQLELSGGGMIAVADGDVLGLVELPIAGLIADRPVRELAHDCRDLERAYRALGSTIEAPYMIFSFLSLAVIPALRLTNRGLVDGIEFALVSPVAE